MSPDAHRLLALEARSLLTRLERVKPLALQETMVPAANVSDLAAAGIERALAASRRTVRRLVRSFLRWLQRHAGSGIPASEGQRRFSLVRLQFNTMLSQLDLFSDAFSQRSEPDVGIWLAGLDVAAEDALALPDYYSSPAVVCYLDRGIGAAIRRARTRLPGGSPSPIALLRVPRERMVGTGIASSLVHEVGHQAAALLDLVGSLRQVLNGLQQGGEDADVWRLWERWISEIVADFWSVARVGIASTLGLIGVVSLPPPFVFRVTLGDPHPMPWVRVKLSCAMGQALHPHPQWARLAALWQSFYPTSSLNHERRALLARLEANMPAFVELLAGHRPPALRGASLREALNVGGRQPGTLAATYQSWQQKPALMFRAAPTLAFATLGQARADGLLTPEGESRAIDRLLRAWALQDTLRAGQACAMHTSKLRSSREYAPAA